MRKTEILPWSEEWLKLYEVEELKLKEIFKYEDFQIYHIGSTSIPTIGHAKPIIDILIAIHNISLVDLYINDLDELGYEAKGENGIEGRRYFTKGKEKRTHHLHIYQAGNENIDIHLDFKNYLLHNPFEARKYGELKKHLANKFHENYLYQSGKEDYVNQLVAKAREWAIQK